MRPVIDSPLFPATGGGASTKALVVTTFEAVGSLLGQSFLTNRHTAVRVALSRVTGALALAAVGVESNKINLSLTLRGVILRHSPDALS